MNRETINPKTEEQWLELRTHDITSTESGAFFGLSPYVTLFELWHKKKNPEVVKIENEAMRWGKRFEESIARGIAEDFNIENIRPMKEYIRLPEHRIGSSFDYAVGDDGIFEIKNVGLHAYRHGWLVEEGEVIEAPVWIESQVQHQLLVSGRQYAYIGACIGGNQGILIRRERDDNVINSILRENEKFWISIEANEVPKPDFEKDAKYINSLFDYAETGKVIDATTDDRLDQMVKAYGEITDHVKMWTSKREEMKAKVLMSIQDAEKVKGGNWTISAGLVGPCHVEYDRKGYRNFRVTWKKDKK
jgi:putative phage-type endonuclease